MYREIIEAGDEYRRLYRDGIDAFLRRLESDGNTSRELFMSADGFAENVELYRKKYLKMLGVDKIGDGNLLPCSIEHVGACEDAEIHRVISYITEEIPTYGLLFIPKGLARKAPLVIVQHGGGGTPELCSDLNGNNNYNHIARRILKRGAIVYAPQLLLWNQSKPSPTQPIHPIEFDRGLLDNGLKRFGISITGLEIKGIMNAITYLSEHPLVDSERIGMTGISYGGYFTLHTMAADTRIKVGFSNACFNDRNLYPQSDFCYPNSANTFHDAEVAALCAPRKLCIAVGKADSVFDYRGAVSEAERVGKYFDACGCPENFIFSLWDGGHTVPDTDEGFDFMFSAF